MGTKQDWGGLIGAKGGGEGGGNHSDDRGFYFPEFDSWAGLQVSGSATINGEDRISETLTIDIDFNDGAWRPASSVFNNSNLPSLGDQHPSIEGCFLFDISSKHRNKQGDLIRVTLDYRAPKIGQTSSGGSGTGGGDEDAPTPLDANFTISFNPIVIEKPLGEDLTGVNICNANGEPYDRSFPTVRLDGICKWNQRKWSQSEITDWVGVVNSKPWSEGDYKFEARTVVCNYVVGNLAFFVNDDGKQEPYYEMQAAISYYPNEIVDKEFKTPIRSQGSFYYASADDRKNDKRSPRDRTGSKNFDIDKETGELLSKAKGVSVVGNGEEQYDKFNIYTPKAFNFVDRQ